MKKKLKVLVDTTPLLKNLTGVGYVTYIYASGLLRLENCTFFYAWFFSRKLRQRPLGNFEKKINLIKKYLPRPYIVTHFIKTIIFNIILFYKKPDIIFQPNYNLFKTYKNFKSIILIHDLSHIKYSQFHPKDRVEYFNKNLEKSIKQATKIVTISNFTKNELIRLNLASEEKIQVIPNGVSKEFKPLNLHSNSNKVLEKYKLKAKGYFLFVGTFEPRKNLKLLLEAYIKYHQSNPHPTPLVLVGTFGWNEEFFSNTLKKALELPDVFRLGYLSDIDLRILYAGAKVFIFPSFYEGFGLPPLEAMASATAVIASNTSSIPEVVVDNGILIDPNNKNELLKAMVLLDEDEKIRLEFEQKGLKRAKSFDWEKSILDLDALFWQITNAS